MSRPLALITGASGGIGEALAHSFARGGHDVALVARSADKLEAVAEAVRRHGVVAHVLPLDLFEADAGARLETMLADQGMTTDVLVNNAGFGFTGPVLAQPLDDQLRMIDLNCRVLTELSWRFGRPMQARRRGGILNVASTAAFQPGPHMAVYYASKAYVLSFTEALNHELRGSGVHATALCPGPVATGFQRRAAFDDSMRLTKVAPMMSAEAVAQAGFEGFQRRRSVVIPGVSNQLMARSAPFTPRAVLLSVVEQLQKKKEAR
jgi:short-subunit dehydrogenase